MVSPPSTTGCGATRYATAATSKLPISARASTLPCSCSAPLSRSFAEAEGRIIAACCIGIFEDGKPRTNPTWVPCYDEMFAQATEMAKTADAKLEGSLFGDSREKATADRFAATGNEYAQGQLNLIIIVPEWQGKGLGRELIDLARAELAKAGCTKFFLMSDCNSDWQFYEHLNMKRILEDHSQDTGDGFIVYMYGGDTQD